MDMMGAQLGWSVGVLACIGCGSVKSIDFDAGAVIDAEASVSDGGTDAESSSPGSMTMCDPLAPFSIPVPVRGLAVGQKFGASLSSDELTIYLWASVDATALPDIYTATRTHINNDFNTPSLLMNLSTSTGEDGDPWISPDGLVVLFTADRDGSLQLYAATRASSLTTFGTPAPLANIQSSGARSRAPYITVDGTELWFVSDRPGGLGGYDVWRADKSGSGFAEPIAVTEVSSTGADFYPMLSSDKLTIYISSRRTSTAPADIWRAQRSTTSDGFGPPVLVNELNMASEDLATWLSPDGCRIYLSSNRTGTREIFVASRSPR